MNVERMGARENSVRIGAARVAPPTTVGPYASPLVPSGQATALGSPKQGRRDAYIAEHADGDDDDETNDGIAVPASKRQRRTPNAPFRRSFVPPDWSSHVAPRAVGPFLLGATRQSRPASSTGVGAPPAPASEPTSHASRPHIPAVPSNAVQQLDRLATALMSACAYGQTAESKRALFRTLMGGIVPANATVGDLPNEWCQELRNVYMPFWSRLRDLERARPGLLDAIGDPPTPNAVWSYVERATGVQRSPRKPWTSWDADAFLEWAAGDAQRALDALQEWMRPQHQNRPAGPIRLVGPQSKAMSRERTQCQTKRTFTLFVYQWEGAPKYWAYIVDDRNPDNYASRTRVILDGDSTYDEQVISSMTHYEPAPTRLLPSRLIKSEDAVLVRAMDALIDAMHGDTLAAWDMRPSVDPLDLPANVPEEVTNAAHRPGTYMQPMVFAAGTIDECDLVALADATDASSSKRNSWMQTRQRLQRPHTQIQRQAAVVAFAERAAQSPTRRSQMLAPGVLDPQVARFAAAHTVSGVCAGGAGPSDTDMDALLQAAPFLGIDLMDRAYLDRPDLLCADVRAAIARMYLSNP